MPVVNPDGYDYTFTAAGTRLWRKNLRDNNGDGQITNGDGVDTNRNFPFKWNWDLEGASADPADETFHGAGPASEPEVRAIRALESRIRPSFLIDYHSAAGLILFPEGWQVETPSTDTPVLRALAGASDDPAVPGYDPEVSAQLCTTNGDITDDAYKSYGILPYTVELDGGAGSAIGGTDGSDPNYTPGGFVFQDDEAAAQAVFEKNLPFALDLARSAARPDEAVSHLGSIAPDLTATTFSTSNGAWNAATGNSNGFQDWNVDLTPFAGKQFELAITYATDPSTQLLGNVPRRRDDRGRRNDARLDVVRGRHARAVRRRRPA